MEQDLRYGKNDPREWFKGILSYRRRETCARNRGELEEKEASLHMMWLKYL
jgi:hypothetical protein